MELDFWKLFNIVNCGPEVHEVVVYEEWNTGVIALVFNNISQTSVWLNNKTVKKHGRGWTAWRWSDWKRERILHFSENLTFFSKFSIFLKFWHVPQNLTFFWKFGIFLNIWHCKFLLNVLAFFCFWPFGLFEVTIWWYLWRCILLGWNMIVRRKRLRKIGHCMAILYGIGLLEII